MLLVVLASGAVACDDSFTPFAPGAQRLSVWGYLDPARDTQWIRIGALRPTVFSSGDSVPVQATLEDLTNGQIVHLSQATVRFAIISPVDSGSTTVHNFWTNTPVRPGASYRFRAQSDIAGPVEAVVRVPADYRMEMLLGPSWAWPTDSLVLFGLPYVAFVTATTVIVDMCGDTSESVGFAPVSDSLHDPHSIPLIRPWPWWRRDCGVRYVVRRTLSVVGSGSAWPQAADPSEMGDVRPGNITNGVGFLGGILSKTIPYENCDYPYSSDSNRYCRLRYDSTTVTLTGQVRFCASPVPGALVTLRELDAPAEVAKLRSIYTDTNGRFWMSALEPGMRYEVIVNGQTDSVLSFTSGEQATHDVNLSTCTASPRPRP